MRRAFDRRGVSPVIGTVLVVAITVILAATIGGLLLTSTGTLQEPAPTIASATGELTTKGGFPTFNGAVVSLTHEAGDTVQVADLEIVVDASNACGKRGRIVNLPLGSNNKVDADNIEGTDIFDGRSITGETDPPYVLLEPQWEPTETLSFQIASCSLDEGDRLTVQVVHEPSRAVILGQTFVVSPQN